MRRLTLYDRLGIAKVRLSAPKNDISLEYDEFCLEFLRFGDTTHIPKYQLEKLRDWMDGAIKELSGD